MKVKIKKVKTKDLEAQQIVIKFFNKKNKIKNKLNKKL